MYRHPSETTTNIKLSVKSNVHILTGHERYRMKRADFASNQ